MIKLNPAPTFEAPVSLTIPGQAEPVVVPMTFKYFTAQQSVDWFKEKAGVPSADALAELVLGWGADSVRADDGTAVPFSVDALKTLIGNYAPATAEILRAWQVALTESRTKN